ncbi:unnamed protein product, partial [Brenthis ino]
MAKKKRDLKIQKKIKLNDASVTSPPYDTKSYESNTKLSMKDNHNKKERIDSDICLCKATYRPKTWQSITGIYGDQETTKIWDSNDQKSIKLYKPLQKNKNNYMKEKRPEKVKNSISQSKYNKNKKYAKKSKGLYRKHNNRINSLKTQENHINDKFVKDKTPTILFKLPRKPKLKEGTLTYHKGTGDSCVGGPCTIDNNYIPQELKNSVVKKHVDKGKTKKQNKDRKDDKSKSIIDHVDHVSPITLEKSNEKTNKGSFLNKIKKITSIHKQSNKSVEKSKEPLFVMKVDSKEMRILNPLEINKNVKKFGISKKHQCICPSRLNISKNVCDNGICRRALTNNRVRFNCKCAKNNIIECKDTTCDSKKRLKLEKNKKKSSKYVDQNNPLFQIMLDPNMSILNSYEVRDIFNKAAKEVCPTGICSVAAKNSSTELNCKCVSKKIKTEVTECTNRTCQPEKKYKISYFCSRIFSKSDNLGHPKRITTNRHVRRPPLETNVEKKKGNLTVQSDAYYKRDGVSINVSRERKRARDDQKDLWCKCFCECSEQTAKIKRKKNLQSGKKGAKRKKSRHSKNKLNKCFLKRKLRRKQIEPLTLKEYLVKCLQKKRVRCEKKIKEKEKEFKNNERKLKKQLLKEKKAREKTMKLDAHNWNCLTNLVNGVLNLVTQSIKNIFSAIFSILTNPFGSFVYFRQRALDPPGTMQKFATWIKMTWTNKSTKISQSVKESHTMNIIADHFEDSVVYDKVFANKGRTTEERQSYEKKKRIRKRRIRKRHDEALSNKNIICKFLALKKMDTKLDMYTSFQYIVSTYNKNLNIQDMPEGTFDI